MREKKTVCKFYLQLKWLKYAIPSYIVDVGILQLMSFSLLRYC